MNATLTKPNSLSDMRKAFDDSNEDKILIWTPVAKINSTSYFDEGEVRHFTDSTSYFGLKLASGFSQWSDNRNLTAYGKACRQVVLDCSLSSTILY